MSTFSKNQITDKRANSKFTPFRILVIGRGNAGKTTILRRLCDTLGKPTIFSQDGEKIESSAPEPSVKPGTHNIEDQIIFEGNPGFIFHDSRGFGSAQEVRLVQEFIERRSKEKNVNDKLHAIWYCIQTSDDRPISGPEKLFFDQCGTGNVPAIVLWTKTESLDLAKIKQLMKKGISKTDAMQQAPQQTWVNFKEKIYPQFYAFKFPPKAYVPLRKMHEPGADCKDLIDKTRALLSSL